MTIEVEGKLVTAAENRTTPDGDPQVMLRVGLGIGTDIEVRLSFPGDAHGFKRAEEFAAAAVKGTMCRALAAGCRSRTDHSFAAEVLLDVKTCTLFVPGQTLDWVRPAR